MTSKFNSCTERLGDGIDKTLRKDDSCTSLCVNILRQLTNIL